MKNADSTIEVPFDIKIVNGATTMLLGLFIALIITCGFQFFINYKNINSIIISGNTEHSEISFLRKNINKNIAGNFHSINLLNTKKMFESLPWINHAVVKRVYPSSIEVRLSEYHPKAIWGSREDMRLIDEAGIIFEVNAQEDIHESLPQLIGPEGQGKMMLEMYNNISNAFTPVNESLKNLELNARGSWIATLDSGAHIELGRGNTLEVVDRATKFSMSVGKMLKKLNKKVTELQYVDLRHTDGYALRLHGVSTLDLASASTSFKK